MYSLSGPEGSITSTPWRPQERLPTTDVPQERPSFRFPDHGGALLIRPDPRAQGRWVVENVDIRESADLRAGKQSATPNVAGNLHQMLGWLAGGAADVVRNHPWPSFAAGGAMLYHFKDHPVARIVPMEAIKGIVGSFASMAGGAVTDALTGAGKQALRTVANAATSGPGIAVIGAHVASRNLNALKAIFRHPAFRHPAECAKRLITLTLTGIASLALMLRANRPG